jgi:hypothetical protein
MNLNMSGSMDFGKKIKDDSNISICKNGSFVISCDARDRV